MTDRITTTTTADWFSAAFFAALVGSVNVIAQLNCHTRKEYRGAIALQYVFFLYYNIHYDINADFKKISCVTNMCIAAMMFEHYSSMNE